MLSDKQVEIFKQINGSKEPKDEKTKNDIELKCTNDKNKYGVHIRTDIRISTESISVLKHGLRLKKMHRAIKFEPKEILKTHIGFNNEKIKNARNDFEKDIFKLLNSALKFMVMIENIRNVKAQQKYSKTKNSIRLLHITIKD